MAQHYAEFFTLPYLRVGSNCFLVLQIRKLRHINVSHHTVSEEGSQTSDPGEPPVTPGSLLLL